MNMAITNPIAPPMKYDMMAFPMQLFYMGVVIPVFKSVYDMG